MIQDDEDTILFGDDASDTFLCLDEENGTTPHEDYGVPWPDQGTHANKQELDDTLLMDDGLEGSVAIDLKLVAQMDFSPLDDAHLGFDSDSDHLGLFEDHYFSSGTLHEDDAEDQMGIPNSEDTGIQDDDQIDDR